MKAMIHIQNTEPNPPRQIAVETPTMLPVPTRDAVETIRAWKDDTDPSLSGFSPTTLTDSPNIRTCRNLHFTVK